MFQSNKKSNKLFYIILTVFILLSLAITFIAIYFTNKGKEENITPPNNDTSGEIATSDTLTIYKKYPINPLKYTYLKENSNVITKISGLKNKEIENKINERIKKNKDCRLQASFSNIISITCEEENINIDLTTGNDIKLEELFQKDTNINENLTKAIYDHVNSGIFSMDLMQTSNYYSDMYYNYYEDQYEDIWLFIQDFFDADAFVLKELEQFKKSFFIEWDSLGYISTLDQSNNYLSFRDFYESIAIYDRFLTGENIYENEVEKYFYPLATNMYLLDSDDNNYYADFAKEKTFLEYQTYFYAVENELSLLEQKEMSNKLFNYIVNNLEKSNEYQYNYYNLFINKKDETYYVETQYNTIDLDKLSFETFIPSISKYEKIYNEIKSKTNLFIDKNGNITIKDDNPYEYFSDFENKLYDYFINDMEEYCEINKWHSECYFKRSLSNLENFKEKLWQISFAIDKDTQTLYLYYVDYYYSDGETFSLQIPFDKLNEIKTDEIENDENITQ